MRFRPSVRWSLLTLALPGVYALLTWQLNSGTGLTQAFFQGAGVDRTKLVERLTTAIDLSILNEDARLPRRFFSVRWDGVWYIPQQGLYDLSLSTGASATWKIDGHVAQETSTADPAGNPRTVSLGAGFHTVEVMYEHEDGTPALSVTWAPAGGIVEPLNPHRLFPVMPTHPRLRVLLETVRSGLRFFGLAGLAVALCLGLLALVRLAFGLVVRALGASAARTVGRVLAIALPVLVIGYGAALRFDALTLKYGSVKSPGWLHSLQERSLAPLRSIRPESVTWDPVPNVPHRDGQWSQYNSDPYTYLAFARDMHSFYAAHYREPVFPFVTKIFLRLLNDQDVAVSWASAFFSVLAILATYLLGSYAFSRWVGLGAALAMAIEYDVISWGVSGWRDDAFTWAAIMCAYAMLRYSRVASSGNAILMGVFAGISCLIRITSLSFLLPGFVYLLLAARRPWKARLSGVGLGVLTMTVVIAPYVLNCWRVYGDPLYAVNHHTGNYLAAEGQVVQSRPTAVAYVETKALSRPFQTLDTVALGLTSYPFLNKWQGFNPWLPAVGTWLSWAALLGLLLFAGSSSGRLLLFLIATSLIPFAVTWKLASDWRFTEHVYPFYLIAACVAIGQAVRWAALSPIAGRLAQRRPGLKPIIFWGAIVGSVGLGGWIVVRALPVLTVRESLRAGEPVTIKAGERDGAFFGEGWSRPLVGDNVTTRISAGPSSVVWIPLPRVDDYDLTVRVDPFPRPIRDRAAMRLPTLRVFVNGSFVCNLDLHWDPARVGSYDVPLSRAVVKQGFNRLVLDGGAFDLWYVRIRSHVAPDSSRQ